tara:strand:- start:511 stop:762 length:252 start_codon:yes stop_codon:yes gene_type:complete
MSDLKKFVKCVDIRKDYLVEGNIFIVCKLGLWGVSGKEYVGSPVFIEAFNYFKQYYEDGEYDEFLGMTDRRIEKLKKLMRREV